MGRKAERALRLGSDLAEFRVDTLEGAVEPDGIASALGRFARRAVFTVRSSREGGRFVGSEEERLGLISQLAEMKPAYLDVELSTAARNDEWLRSLPKSVPRIVSWHDFEGTPAMSALRRTCQQGLEHGSVAKVVTTATKIEDNLRTVRLCEENRGKAVSFCMGEAGAVSRVVSMGVGAPIVYAALPNDAVAPGQLSIPTMVEFRGLFYRDD